jgi:hypothetical protein
MAKKMNDAPRDKPPAVKLTRQQREQIDALALRIYDGANPRPFERINRSKHDCIKEARTRLFPESR